MIFKKTFFFLTLLALPLSMFCTKTIEQLTKEISFSSEIGIITPNSLPEKRLGYEIHEYIKDGGDVNARGWNRETLLIAVSNPSDDSSKFLTSIDELLTAKADPNLQDKEGSTALMYLVRNSNIEGITRLLQESNIDLLKKNKYGSTAYQIARANEKILKLLNEYRQKIGTQETKPHRQQEVINNLNTLFADIGALNSTTQYKEKAVLEEKAVQIITDFTKQGHDLISGEQDAELLLTAVKLSNLALLKSLIDQGKLNPNAYQYGVVLGVKLLNIAISEFNSDMVRFLLTKIDKNLINMTEKNEITPLEFIVRKIIRFEKSKITSANAQLIYKKQKLLKMLTYFLEAGADQSVLDKYIDPQSPDYIKDIATYVNEFNREQKRYMQADLKK